MSTLIAHNTLRLIVSILLILAFLKSYQLYRNPDSKGNFKKIGLPLIISMDVQALLGIILFMDKVDSFFEIQHFGFMLSAIILAHIGYSTSKKVIDGKINYLKMTVLFGISIFSILIGTPWFRPFLRIL